MPIRPLLSPMVLAGTGRSNGCLVSERPEIRPQICPVVRPEKMPPEKRNPCSAQGTGVKFVFIQQGFAVNSVS